ncbi:hypothetical protein LDENG_00150340 [Lucifuga dentata]|nr:hypothetical protein LDENG_00150340 [Lucifuga dentata]
MLCVSANEDFDWTKNERSSFCYGIFPTGFSWGAGSSAYQTEGAWNTDGKGMSIWDEFSHRKGKIFFNDTGDSSCEGYYKFKDDVPLMKDMKLNHYRFSISWPRILPKGLKSEHINEKGIKYYDDLINMLLDNKITPIVTLYHWDLPQSIAVEGYETGEHAPGLKLKGTGVYRAAHHIIKAHAKVWHTYDAQWRSKQKGLVGILLTAEWGEPVDISSQKDIEAAERFVQFYMGWFATLLFNGDYPQVMKDYVGRKSGQQALGVSRLPVFSPQEKSFIKGTCNFLGVGHFTTRYVTQKNYPSGLGDSYFTDHDLAELVDPRWPDPGSEWLYSVPWGFRRLLNFVKTQYGNPMIYVTENGVSEKMICTDLCDEWRMQYFKEYINEMLKAIKDGVNVKGYTAWSLLDNFEWDEGFSERFRLYYVDFRSKNKPRYPKASVQYYKRIISSNGFPNQREMESWKRKDRETCSSSNQLLAAGWYHMTLQQLLPHPSACMDDPLEEGLYDIPDNEDEAFPPFPPPHSPGQGGAEDAGPFANGEEEGEQSKLADVPAAKRKAVKRPQPKLDSQRLISERGLPALRTLFDNIHFKGKGHEAEDLQLLMQKMENWAHRLFPKLQFEDFIEKVEKLGSKKEVQTCLKRIRLDMPLTHDDFIGKDDGEEEAAPETLVFGDPDPFGGVGFSDERLVHLTPAPAAPSLTEEQQKRMELNRLRALERRIARQQHQQLTDLSDSNPADSSTADQQSSTSSARLLSTSQDQDKEVEVLDQEPEISVQQPIELPLKDPPQEAESVHSSDSQFSNSCQDSD